MAKSKSKSDIENLRGIIRSLKSQNRNIKKQLSRSEKRRNIEYETPDLDEDLELIPEPSKKDPCPKCGQELNISDMGVRILVKCSSCNYRTSKKK